MIERWDLTLAGQARSPCIMGAIHRVGSLRADTVEMKAFRVSPESCAQARQHDKHGLIVPLFLN